MIDHVGFEVADLERSGRFYDAVFATLGVRRMRSSDQAIAYGVTEPTFWLTARAQPAHAYGHIALRAAGKAAVDAAHEAALASGGRCDGEPGPRPRYGPRYYAAYLRDPDGLRVEVVAGSGP
jgi:catechol 2,3-dioxygenase-like lactoylglutathione lyase family enzyme